MGSNQISLFTKRFVHVNVKGSDVTGLKALSQNLDLNRRNAFVHRYGKILELAMIDTPPPAITALVQFYDQELRCFTFSDFQLAPSIEEFEKTLGCPMASRKPYLFSGEHAPLSKVAEVIGISESELKVKQQNKSGGRGFPKSYLEGKAKELADKGDWGTFMSMLAILIFGLVLLPSSDDFVSMAAIDAFLAYHYRKESPVVVVLADTYNALDLSCRKKCTKIICCLPALYVWLVTLVLPYKGRSVCPFEDFRMCSGKNSINWESHLGSLSGMGVRWSPGWKEVFEVLCQCKGFPNVPLMGTRGGINYNPILSVRQLGYPLRSPPSNSVLVPFVVRGFEAVNVNMFHKIKAAWDLPVRKGNDLKKRDNDVVGSYGQWLIDRAEQVKLPRQSLLSRDEKLIEEPTIEDEEMRQLKEKLQKVENENIQLKDTIAGVQRESEAWQETTTWFLEQAMEKANQEKEKRLRYQATLAGVSLELKRRRDERDEARTENKILRRDLADAKEAEESLKEQLGMVQANMSSIIDRMTKEKKELAMVHNKALREQQSLTLEKTKEYENAMAWLEEKDNVILALCEEGDLWMSRFATIMRGSQDLPELVAKAEQMADVFSTPNEVRDLFDYCNYIVELMKDIVRRR